MKFVSSGGRRCRWRYEGGLGRPKRAKCLDQSSTGVRGVKRPEPGRALETSDSPRASGECYATGVPIRERVEADGTSAKPPSARMFMSRRRKSPRAEVRNRRRTIPCDLEIDGDAGRSGEPPNNAARRMQRRSAHGSSNHARLPDSLIMGRHVTLMSTSLETKLVSSATGTDRGCGGRMPLNPEIRSSKKKIHEKGA